jgi:hypothetical protein
VSGARYRGRMGLAIAVAAAAILGIGATTWIINERGLRAWMSETWMINARTRREWMSEFDRQVDIAVAEMEAEDARLPRRQWTLEDVKRYSPRQVQLAMSRGWLVELGFGPSRKRTPG